MLERFLLPDNDSRLLRCKDKLYKVKLNYVTPDVRGGAATQLPCSGDTMHKEIELAIRSLLSAAHSDVVIEKLKTQHFGIKISRRSWNLGLRMTFKQHGKLLRAHPQVLVMDVSPQERPEGEEVDKPLTVLKKGIEVVSPQVVDDDLDGLELSESDVECQNRDEPMESELSGPVQSTNSKDVDIELSSLPDKLQLEDDLDTPIDLDLDNLDAEMDGAGLDAVKENKIPTPPAKKLKISPVKKLKVNLGARGRNGPAGKYTHAKRSVRVHVEEKEEVEEPKEDEEDEDDTIPDLDSRENQPGDSRNEGTNDTSEDCLPPAPKTSVRTRFDPNTLPKVCVNLGTRVDQAQMKEVVAVLASSAIMVKKRGPKSPVKPRPKVAKSPTKRSRAKQEADMLEEMRLKALSATTTAPTEELDDMDDGPLKKHRVTPSRMGVVQALDLVVRPVRHLFQTTTTTKKK